jgi:hypothetical protein
MEDLTLFFAYLFPACESSKRRLDRLDRNFCSKLSQWWKNGRPGKTGLEKLKILNYGMLFSALDHVCISSQCLHDFRDL